MGFGFRKSVSLGKGVRVNLSKSGIGLSGGVKGFRVGANSRGTYVRGSIPGTGIYSHQNISKGKAKASSTEAGSFASCLPLMGFLMLLILTLSIPPVGLLLWGVAGFFYWKHTKTANYQNNKARKEIKSEDLASARSILTAIAEPDTETLFLLGLVDYAEEKYDYAVKKFEQLKENDKLSLGSYAYPYADSLQNLGRFPEAVLILQNVLKNDSQEIKLLNLLAHCFIEQEKYNLAIEALKKAPTRKKHLDEDLLETLYQLGLCNELLGKNAVAKKHYTRVYAHDRSYKEVEARLQNLETGKKE